MGATTEVITYYTCDICHNACGPADGRIVVEIHPGDGRDVGPGYLKWEPGVFVPYAGAGKIVCEPCKLKWLRKYLADKEQP